MISELDAANNALKCPRCHNTDLRRSSRRRLLDKVLSPLNLYPYRCWEITCQHRFYVKESEQIQKHISIPTTHASRRPVRTMSDPKPELLTLHWHENGTNFSKSLSPNDESGQPTSIRLGRDPRQSDLVFNDKTVSGLHAEIYFTPRNNKFYLRNLSQTNRTVVDGNQVFNTSVLTSGVLICLGLLEITAEIESEIEPTILLCSE